MINTKKLIITLVMLTLTLIGLTGTALAAELTGEQTHSKEIVSNGYAADTSPSLEATNPNAVQDGNTTVKEPGNSNEVEVELPAENYYIDEQGEVYYEEPDAGNEDLIIDTVIEDDTEEDIEKEIEDKKEVTKKPSYSEKELRLLSSLIYAESGNQSYEGMLAVANVVLNRVKSKVYWHANTVEEVIYDRKWSVQFSVTVKNKKSGLSILDKALKYYDTGKFSGANPEAEKKAMNKAIKAAKSALEGTNNIGDYLCFHSKSYAGSIKKKYSDYKIIGGHIFFRTK